MFKHLLVPVDSSSSSGQAVRKALGLAQACGSAVTAIYVVDPYAFSGVGADFSYGQAEYLGAASLEAEEALKATREIFEGQGLTISTSLVEGHAVYRGILETAAKVGADLIVMGSHGRRGLDNFAIILAC